MDSKPPPAAVCCSGGPTPWHRLAFLACVQWALASFASPAPVGDASQPRKTLSFTNHSPPPLTTVHSNRYMYYVQSIYKIMTQKKKNSIFPAIIWWTTTQSALLSLIGSFKFLSNSWIAREPQHFFFQSGFCKLHNNITTKHLQYFFCGKWSSIAVGGKLSARVLKIGSFKLFIMHCHAATCSWHHFCFGILPGDQQITQAEYFTKQQALKFLRPNNYCHTNSLFLLCHLFHHPIPPTIQGITLIIHIYYTMKFLLS